MAKRNSQHNIFIQLAFDAIKKYATEEKPLDANTILEKIMEESPDNKCERKTILRALKRLRSEYGLLDGEWINDDIRLHYDTVARKTSDSHTNYWLEISEDIDEELFTDEELMFLIDAVQFSKHISYRYAEDIIKKLIKLSPNSFSDKFKMYKDVSKDYHTLKKDFFLNLGVINDAIHKRKKISFYANQYNLEKKLCRVGNTPSIVSPYRIVASDGNYYVIYRADSSYRIKSIRIDRISNVEMLDEDYVTSPEMGRIKSHPEEYITSHRYMNSGKVVDVTLSIDRTILDDVIDAFGTGIKIDTTEATSNSLRVHVKSSETDIVDWVIRYSKYCVVLEPTSIHNEVMTRALHLAYFFIHDEKEEYENRLDTAVSTGKLTLLNIDLNKFSTFKDLKNLKVVLLGCNWIRDFSFLLSYPLLEELYIEYNTIQDISVISKINKLKKLGLYNTEITSLDFLKGLDKLDQLELDEYFLDDIEAIYDLPNLKELYVNKTTAVLIDEKRLKKAHADKEFVYELVDFGGKPGKRPSMGT